MHRLKWTEDSRAMLVECAISSDKEEDLGWDLDDDGEIKEAGKIPSKLLHVKLKNYSSCVALFFGTNL